MVGGAAGRAEERKDLWRSGGGWGDDERREEDDDKDDENDIQHERWDERNASGVVGDG